MKGFAGMDPERRKALASQGGKKAHANGSAHVWTREEARAAGRKGGLKVSANKRHMREIGIKGGKAKRR